MFLLVYTFKDGRCQNVKNVDVLDKKATSEPLLQVRSLLMHDRLCRGIPCACKISVNFIVVRHSGHACFARLHIQSRQMPKHRKVDLSDKKATLEPLIKLRCLLMHGDVCRGIACACKILGDSRSGPSSKYEGVNKFNSVKFPVSGVARRVIGQGIGFSAQLETQ